MTLNGFHETRPIVYPEDAYGLARTGQTIVAAPDASVVRLFVDDEPFDLATARVTRFERISTCSSASSFGFRTPRPR